jgi:hypothetical protein
MGGGVRDAKARSRLNIAVRLLATRHLLALGRHGTQAGSPLATTRSILGLLPEQTRETTAFSAFRAASRLFNLCSRASEL